MQPSPPKNIGIHFGALADPISTQLEKQGFKFVKKHIDGIEKVLDALIICCFSGLISDSQREKAHKKIYKRIVTHVCAQNKLKANR